MKGKKNLLWLAVTALLLIWTARAVLREQTPGELRQALSGADVRFLLLALGLMAVFLGCEAKSTHWVLRALGVPQPYRNCYFYSCTGFFFSSITPSASGGQPAQVCYMSRDGVPAACGTVDMLLVTVGYQTAAVAFGVLALATGGNLPERLGGQAGLLLGLGLVIFAALSGAMLCLLFLPGPARRLGLWTICLAARVKPDLDRTEWEKKLNDQLDRCRRSAGLVCADPSLLPRVLLMSAGQLACSYAVPYCVCLSFHLAGVSFWEVFCLQALCSVSVACLPFPGGAGAAESLFLRAFSLIFGPALVAPAMIASRTVSCYLVLLATGLVTAVGHAARAGRQRPEQNKAGLGPKMRSEKTSPVP